MIQIKVDLLFDPERRVLTNGDKESKLTDNMTRCLLVLLKYRGEVVSKETLLKEVWEKNGVIVTDTSIRQTLSQLRKSITSLNINEELIYTLPRQGYKLPQFCATAEENFSDMETPISSGKTQAYIPEDACTPVSKDRRRFFKWLLMMIATAFIIIILSTFVYFRYYLVTDVIYVRISDNASREILIFDSLHTDKAYISSAMHALDSYIDGDVVKVPASYQVYINRTLMPGAFSFFICDRVGRPHNCQAVYIYNGLIK